jgi:hypothetical protein
MSVVGRGFVEGALDHLAIAAGLLAGLAFVPLPADRFFGSVAQIGATLLVAYAVEVSWLAKTSNRRGPSHQEWIGIASSTGVSGLSGIAVSLGIAEHLRAGHENWLDYVGFAWSVTSVLLLGLAVALQPLLTYSWRRSDGLD